MRGKMKINKVTGSLLLVFLLTFLLLPAGRLDAQEVALRAGDRINLTVPQREELDRTLTISPQGTVHIPIVGHVALEGLTVEEAENVLLRALREVYPSVRAIEVDLLGEESRRAIYVLGQVETPGRYGFEENPTVWEAIREAGGALPTAALDVIRVVRSEGDQRRTFLVDLRVAIENGTLEDLPVLEPGDAVIVSQTMAVQAGSGSVKVIGMVTTPGPYQLGGEKTLVDALLAAGGPVPDADLKKVSIVRERPDGATLVISVNFERYLREGDIRHNPLILPNDTVSVPAVSGSIAALHDPRFWITAVTAAAAAYAIFR
jgi:polysaccharide export outer membrane protein